MWRKVLPRRVLRGCLVAAVACVCGCVAGFETVPVETYASTATLPLTVSLKFSATDLEPQESATFCSVLESSRLFRRVVCAPDPSVPVDLVLRVSRGSPDVSYRWGASYLKTFATLGTCVWTRVTELSATYWLTAELPNAAGREILSEKIGARGDGQILMCISPISWAGLVPLWAPALSPRLPVEPMLRDRLYREAADRAAVAVVEVLKKRNAELTGLASRRTAEVLEEDRAAVRGGASPGLPALRSPSAGAPTAAPAGVVRGTPIVVYRARFVNLPPAQARRVAGWDAALAAEVSGVVRSGRGWAPMEFDTLREILGKEKFKATLACEDTACLNRIIENFGMSDALDTTIRYISGTRVQVTMTHTASGDVLQSLGPVYSALEFEDLAAAIRGLARDMFGAPTP